MKYLGKITDNKDLVTKEYVDSKRGSEFIYGTQSATTNVWLGTTEDSELYDGKQILYFLPYAGTSTAATLNLTLSGGGTTGAKNVYFQSTTRMTTHYGAYSQFRLVYHQSLNINGTNYEGWWSEPGRDTTTTNATQIQHNQAIKAGSTAIVAANIIVAGSDGLYKHLKAGTAFDITQPILYASAAIAASATGTSNYSEINFTVTTTQSITLTLYKPVYIKGTLSGTTFTPISTAPLTQTLPSSDDGYQYLYFGYATGSTTCRLLSKHPIFAHKGGVFGPYSSGVSTGSTTHSGRLAKFSGDGIVVDGPTLGTSTTTFLRNDGTWAIPSGSVPSNVLLCTGDNGTSLTVEANSGDVDCNIFTTSARNVANGLAPLDANSKVPFANLPATLSTFTNSSAVSISSGTSTTNVVSFTLAAGYWVVNYQLRYGANGTGFRRAEIMDASSNNLSWVQSPAVDSYVTVLNGTILLHPTASTTYRLVGMQNSGAALSVPADGGVVTAMRIA